MTRADPSTYYTPPRILALCEPQTGSGTFLADLVAHPPFDADPVPSVADPIQLTGREDGDSPARGNGSATEAAGPHGHPLPDLALCVGVDRAGVPVAGARPVATGAAS